MDRLNKHRAALLPAGLGVAALVGAVGMAPSALLAQDTSVAVPMVRIDDPVVDETANQFTRDSGVAISGNWALIGDPEHDATIGGTTAVGAGQAYWYENVGGTWELRQSVTPDDLGSDSEFGYALDLYGDTAVVGAFRDPNDGSNIDERGSAYVYANNGGTWVQQAKLTPSVGLTGDHFGYSVGVTDNRAIVGAFRTDDFGSESGVAYVFGNTGGTWAEEARLVASDSAADDEFGYSTDISGDFAIVGAYRNDDAGDDSGSAYIFSRDTSGSWTETAKLTASDADTGDWLGWDVAISGDTAVVGAFRAEDTDVNDQHGAAYVFEFNGSEWVEITKLIASDSAIGDQYGYSVDIAGDIIVVGAESSDEAADRAGSFYVWQEIDGVWTEIANVYPDDEFAAGDNVGHSIATDGLHVITGTEGGTDRAYIYPVPEPTSAIALAMGAAAMAFRRKRA